MDSFYGGKQGISFVIKERFASISDMINEFKNPDYNGVWYGEYCIIDTGNRNHKDNGKIFRRTGFNAEADSGSEKQYAQYAEYMGQVLGPSGGVPNVQMETFEGLNTNFHALSSSNPPEDGLVYYYDDNNKYTQQLSSTITNDNHLGSKIYAPHVDYVSGKNYYLEHQPPADESEALPQPGPNLEYQFYTFQSNKKGDDDEFPIATVGIAFKIPYVDMEIAEIEATDPDTPFSIKDTLDNIVTGSGKRIYPFYRRYKVKAPTNIPGPSLRDIETFSSSDSPIPLIYQINDTEFKEGKLVLKDDAEAINKNNNNRLFASHTKVEVGKLYYYDTEKVDPQDSSKGMIGYTPVQTLTAPSTDAYFYIKDVYELTSVTFDTDRKRSSNYGLFQAQTTDAVNPFSVNTKVPLIESIKVSLKKDENEQDNFYHLIIKYAGESTEEDFKIAPTQWGVWATELHYEGNELKPDGALPQEGQDLQTMDRSQGDLGIYRYTDSNTNENRYQFYFWEITETEDNAGNKSWTGEWTPVGEGVLSTNFSVEDFVFSVNSSNNPLVITHTSIETNSPSAISAVTPWQ